MFCSSIKGHQDIDLERNRGAVKYPKYRRDAVMKVMVRFKSINNFDAKYKLLSSLNHIRGSSTGVSTVSIGK